MQSLQIDTGVIKLQIVDKYGDERGIFCFNPEDVKTAEKFIDMQKTFEVKRKEIEDKINKSESADDRISVTNELIDYLIDTIDTCFGKGSSEILFGNARTLSMFEVFFEGITPYYKKASDERINKFKAKTTRKTKTVK